MNRRHFLSIIAAGLAAPAIVKAENIMRIWTPPERTIVNPFAGMWQDTRRTIPVTAVGQSVAVWDQEFFGTLIAPMHARPKVVFIEGRGYGTEFTGNAYMRSFEPVTL